MHIQKDNITNNMLFVICSIIYRLLLDFIYRYQISPVFSYMLMENHMTYDSYMLSWLYFAIFLYPTYLFYIRRNDNFVTAIFVIFLFALKLIPLSSILAFQPQSISYTCQHVIMWVFLLILLYNSSPITFKLFKPSNVMVGIIAIVMSLAVILVSGLYANFRLNFSLTNVYDLRMEAREFQMPIVLKYIYAAAANIIPVCIVYYIIRRNKWAVFALVFIGLLNFSVAGSKSTLFRILLSLCLLCLRKINFKKWIIPSFLVLSIVSLLEFHFNNSSVISSLLIRRSLYIPSLLDHVYFNYFANIDPYIFDTSKFTDIQFDIGKQVYLRDDVRANNGFFTDAYINLGSVGCVIYPLIYCILLRLFEGACKGKDKCISVFCVFLLVTTLESTYFTTSLLTHGIFLMIIALYLMPSNSYYTHNSNQLNTTKI